MHEFLASIPYGLLILVVGGLIGVESIGLPLPGETVLVAALLIALQDDYSPWWIFAAAVVGAVVGDNVGYVIGRYAGVPILDVLRRKLPHTFRTESILSAATMMSRYGAWAIFVARFVALLRILSGPLAGTLRMPYPTFFVANFAGAIAWAGSITLAVTIAGPRARDLLHQASWVLFALAAVAIVLAVVAFIVRRKRRLTHPEPQLSPERAALPLSTLLSDAAAEGRRAARTEAQTAESPGRPTGS